MHSVQKATSNKAIDSNHPYIIHAQTPQQAIQAHHIAQAQRGLTEQGWALFRGFNHDLTLFSQLVRAFCHTLTFDPAREYSDATSQKVDAGTQAVGLHTENGNTPFPPDVVAFYSQKSALTGSQTTLCDGASLYKALPKHIQQAFESNIIVSRTLPKHLWQAYVAHEHPALNKGDQVSQSHLEEVMSKVPGQVGHLNKHGDLEYHLTIAPLIKKAGVTAFANALLGPSYNYQPPRYRFTHGQAVSQALLQEVAFYAEAHTKELQWQDGDMILIDNTRVMHGRRAIEGDPAQRQLVIAMGRQA